MPLETPYRFEPFGEQHKDSRNSFTCGEKFLEEYLKRRARREMDHRIVVVYALLNAERERIAGYYTLSALSAALLEDMRKAEKLAKYPSTRRPCSDGWPSTKAIRARGSKTGYSSTPWGALAGSRAVASYAVITDTRNEQARALYTHYGFMPLPAAKDEGQLFLPMGTVEGLFAGR